MARLGSMVVKGKLPRASVQTGGGRTEGWGWGRGGWLVGGRRGGGRGEGVPTLAVVSVRLLRVVDLPELGLPTRAIRGSRGMVGLGRWVGEERGGGGGVGEGGGLMK